MPALLLVLVLLGDFLFWGYQPGLALAVFAWAIFAAAGLIGPVRQGLAWPGGLLALATQPVIEHVQPLSLTLLGAGLLAGVAGLRTPRGKGMDGFLVALVHLVEPLPMTGALACARQISDLRQHLMRGRLLARTSTNLFLRNWAFPLGGSLVLSALLIGANGNFALRA